MYKYLFTNKYKVWRHDRRPFFTAIGTHLQSVRCVLSKKLVNTIPYKNIGICTFPASKSDVSHNPVAVLSFLLGRPINPFKLQDILSIDLQ